MSIIKKAHALKKSPNDDVFTPLPVAMKMIEMCNITSEMSVLDCSKGAGVFYDNLPLCNKDWCEIKEGRNFFDYNERVDLIIGNPPFSMWSKWIEHTMKLTDKFCFIIGICNFSDKRIRDIHNAGYGITKIHLLKVDWWYFLSYIIICEKGKESILTVEEKRILCDICNARCGRGQKGKPMNECGKMI